MSPFLVIVVACLLLVIWFVTRKRKAAKAADRERREASREANKALKELNKSLGVPEGTGLTGIMVEGEYRVVNVGHAERMKNDPTYAFGDEMAGILVEMNDLESALKEATARSDDALANKIRNELVD
jgi:hypothetical protein